jgi:hypothetical protein
LAILLPLLSCDGDDPVRPATGTLSVHISGLPDGVAAGVNITGPGGFTHNSTASETLDELVAGRYTITSGSVTHDGSTFAPQIPTQFATVSALAPASAGVAYDAVTGAIAIEISGLPDGSEALVHVTGPSGDTRQVNSSQLLANIPPGEYTISASEVIAGASTFAAAPAAQTVEVTAGVIANVSVAYSVLAVATLNLKLDGAYVTQGIQTLGGDVPLLAGKDAYLRVFVTANEANSVAPLVRARIFHGAALAATLTLSPGATSVPTVLNEELLSRSWNGAVPGSLIQPGLSIAVDVDPGNVIPEADEDDNAMPTGGAALAVEVRSAPPFLVRFVPVEQSTTGLIGDVSTGNIADYLDAPRVLHPIVSVDADLRAPYTTTAPALEVDDANGSWLTILNELFALRVAEGSSRSYYGVVRTPYDLGVGGLGYVGTPVAVGWDRDLLDRTKLLGASNVAAHEWGHNWGRLHSPCGTSGGEDPEYPYPGGTIGVSGFNVADARVVTRFSADIMSYCDFPWISDYTYRGVLDFRESALPVAVAGTGTRSSLLVWGRIDDGRVVLEPAFQVETRPSLPRRGGAYSVEGIAADGTRLFSLSFDGVPVADVPGTRAGNGPRHFAFAVPLTSTDLERLSVLRAGGPGGEATMRSTVAQRPLRGELEPGEEVRTAGPDRLEIRWNAATFPMAMVRDARTGQILSFARGGAATLRTSGAEVEVQFSDRVRSVSRTWRPR